MTRLICDGAFYPLATNIGFVGASLDEVVLAITGYSSIVGTNPVWTPIKGQLCEGLRALGAPKHNSSVFLLFQHREWTALLDNHDGGGQPEMLVPLLAEDIGRRAVLFGSRPNVATPVSFGQIKFELYDGAQCVRWLAATNDGGRWEFDAGGVTHDSELVNMHEWRNSSGELNDRPAEDLCQSLGLDPFNGSAYGPQARLLTTKRAGR